MDTEAEVYGLKERMSVMEERSGTMLDNTEKCLTMMGKGYELMTKVRVRNGQVDERLKSGVWRFRLHDAMIVIMVGSSLAMWAMAWHFHGDGVFKFFKLVIP